MKQNNTRKEKVFVINKDYEKKRQIADKEDKLSYKVVERILNDPMFKATLEYNKLRGLAL